MKFVHCCWCLPADGLLLLLLSDLSVECVACPQVRAFINHSGLEKSRFDGKTQLGICNLLALENGEFAD